MKVNEVVYQKLFETAQEAIIIIDANTGLILDANPSVSLFFGYQNYELIEKLVWEVELFQNILKSKKSFFDISKQNIPLNIELPIPTKNRKIVLVEVVVNWLNIKEKNILLFTFRDIYKQKKTEFELNESNKKLHELTLNMQEVIENEKRRIAVDLHDDLGQKLTALCIDLSWLKARIKKDSPHLLDKVNDITELLNLSMKNVQEIATKLSPSVLDNLGLISAVEWLLEEHKRRSNIDYQFNVSLEEIKVNKRLTVAIFRIIQEALTNVVRHANATMVKVGVQKENKLLNVMVKDNGKGITKSNIEDSKSFGLMGIKERASAFNGKVEITGELNKGTELIVKIPYEQ